MNVFDIVGPVMVGPSSSHTAGAVRIGRMARRLLGEEPAEVYIQFHGSFARTYRGHGTDRAVIAGLLGFEPDDTRIRESLLLAEQRGWKVTVETAALRDAHPNTAVIRLLGRSGRAVTVTGSSMGGGNILIRQIDDLKVEISGEYHTLVVPHRDTPGVVAAVTGVLAAKRVNIARMNVYRRCRGCEALMVIELDQDAGRAAVDEIGRLAGVLAVTALEPI
ncbi:MAG: L-serine ammonia-lyase, iron-sulfur-dependent subunit beta [Bacillota bacterium]|uniref:L-serine ammonia-lyase, iron-sulfur-dependent subunit beta n=1 Tax=Desulforudis sp. DRI-14 TaxID=3459793 RepID=UPI003473115F